METPYGYMFIQGLINSFVAYNIHLLYYIIMGVSRGFQAPLTLVKRKSQLN